jgi:ribose transport system substrate-binding protein
LEPAVEGTYYVGQSYPEQGENLAKATIDACAGHDPCNVVYMPGTSGYGPVPTISKAFKGALEAEPSIKIVAEQDGNYDTDTARSVMTNILQANKDVHVVASGADQQTNGIESALERAGVQGVKLVSIGGAAQAIEAIEAGRQFANIALFPYSEGYNGAKIVIEAVRGDSPPTVVDTAELSPVGPIVTEENAADFEAEYSS